MVDERCGEERPAWVRHQAVHRWDDPERASLGEEGAQTFDKLVDRAGLLHAARKDEDERHEDRKLKGAGHDRVGVERVDARLDDHLRDVERGDDLKGEDADDEGADEKRQTKVEPAPDENDDDDEGDDYAHDVEHGMSKSSTALTNYLKFEIRVCFSVVLLMIFRDMSFVKRCSSQICF